MTYTFLPKPNEAKLKALTERLYERLVVVKQARKLDVSGVKGMTEWTKGFDDALDDEIVFLTELLDALEKS